MNATEATLGSAGAHCALSAPAVAAGGLAAPATAPGGGSTAIAGAGPDLAALLQSLSAAVARLGQVLQGQTTGSASFQPAAQQTLAGAALAGGALGAPAATAAVQPAPPQPVLQPAFAPPQPLLQPAFAPPQPVLQPAFAPPAFSQPVLQPAPPQPAPAPAAGGGGLALTIPSGGSGDFAFSNASAVQPQQPLLATGYVLGPNGMQPLGAVAAGSVTGGGAADGSRAPWSGMVEGNTTLTISGERYPPADPLSAVSPQAQAGAAVGGGGAGAPATPTINMQYVSGTPVAGGLVDFLLRSARTDSPGARSGTGTWMWVGDTAGGNVYMHVHGTWAQQPHLLGQAVQSGQVVIHLHPDGTLHAHDVA